MLLKIFTRPSETEVYAKNSVLSVKSQDTSHSHSLLIFTITSQKDTRYPTPNLFIPMKKTLFLFHVSTLCLSRTLASTICRSNRRLIPHQNSLWFQNFPYETHPNDAVALCEGSITQDEESGEICIDGRVSYRQLADTIGKPIFAPASSTISVTGHLVTGSGNVVLGEKAKFIQDFVTSVTVNNEEHIIENNDTSTKELSTGNVFSKSVSTLRNGTTTVAGNLTDLLFTASRGTIDGVCFSSDFAQDKSYYSISQKSWAPGNVDKSELQNANLIFGSRLRVVGEFHESAGAPLISANTVLSLFNIILTIPIPAIFYSFIPVLPIAGILRQAMVFGTVSTKKRALHTMKSFHKLLFFSFSLLITFVFFPSFSIPSHDCFRYLFTTLLTFYRSSTSGCTISISSKYPSRCRMVGINESY